jgi:hypothetical protein
MVPGGIGAPDLKGSQEIIFPLKYTFTNVWLESGATGARP